MEDVQMMCEKRKNSLRKLATRVARPVHAVTPEPAVPLHYPISSHHSSSTSSNHQSTSSSLPHSHPASPHHSGGETPKSPKSNKKVAALPRVRNLLCYIFNYEDVKQLLLHTKCIIP